MKSYEDIYSHPAALAAPAALPGGQGGVYGGQGGGIWSVRLLLRREYGGWWESLNTGSRIKYGTGFAGMVFIVVFARSGSDEAISMKQHRDCRAALAMTEGRGGEYKNKP